MGIVLRRRVPAGRSRRTGRGALPGLLTLLLATAALAGTAVEVYRPRHRLASELAPLAETTIAGRGSATLDPNGNAIVLIGDPGAVRTTRSLLEQLDVARRSIVLHYESRTERELTAEGLRVDWSLESGGTRVGSVRFPDGEEGLRVGAFSARSRGAGDFAGVLRVLEGEAGRIETGRSVPVTIRDRQGVTTRFSSAGSGFEARPRVLGDGRVEVVLQPFEGSVDEAGRTRFTGAATTLRVRPGETAVLGSIDRSFEGETRWLPGGASARGDESRLLLLTVRVDDPGSAPRR